MNTALLENVVGQSLTKAAIGLLEHEINHGPTEFIIDGFDGEVHFEFENGAELFVSWGAAPHEPKYSFCTQVSSNSFHDNTISFVQASDITDLGNAIGKKLNQVFVFGQNRDPLSIQLVFTDYVMRLGTFDYCDTIFIKESDSQTIGKENDLEVLWAK